MQAIIRKCDCRRSDNNNMKNKYVGIKFKINVPRLAK